MPEQDFMINIPEETFLHFMINIQKLLLGSTAAAEREERGCKYFGMERG